MKTDFKATEHLYNDSVMVRQCLKKSHSTIIIGMIVKGFMQQNNWPLLVTVDAVYSDNSGRFTTQFYSDIVIQRQR